MAAVLACGPDALLSHRAAAALWELSATPSGPIDVDSAEPNRLPGVRSHLSRCPSSAHRGHRRRHSRDNARNAQCLTKLASLSTQRLSHHARVNSSTAVSCYPERFDAHAGHRGLKPVTAALDSPRRPRPLDPIRARTPLPLSSSASAGLPEPLHHTSPLRRPCWCDFFWPPALGLIVR